MPIHSGSTSPASTHGLREVPTQALGPELLAGYGLPEAEASKRRAWARDLANAEVARDLSNDPVDVVNEEGLPPGLQRALQRH